MNEQYESAPCVDCQQPTTHRCAVDGPDIGPLPVCRNESACRRRRVIPHLHVSHGVETVAVSGLVNDGAGSWFETLRIVPIDGPVSDNDARLEWVAHVHSNGWEVVA